MRTKCRAAGDGFARYRLHNGWVTMGGEMSKSLGYYLGSALPVDARVRRPLCRMRRLVEDFLPRSHPGAACPGVIRPPTVRRSADDRPVCLISLEIHHSCGRRGNGHLPFGHHDGSRRRDSDDKHPGL